MRKRKMEIIAICAVCIGAFWLNGCRKKEIAKPEAAEEETTQDTKEDEKKKAPDDVEKIISAMQKTMALPSFDSHTEALINLKGTFIKGEYSARSDIEIVQGSDAGDFQMTMVSTSDFDSTPAKAYYKDGWYYTDDKNGKQKIEKTADDVMENINTATELVTSAAENIDQIQVSVEGENQVYTYHIPEYLAEEYLERLAQSAADSTQLQGAAADVEQLEMISTVNPKGLLVKQEMVLSGSVKKSIIKVPVNVSVTATFKECAKRQLDIPEF